MSNIKKDLPTLYQTMQGVWYHDIVVVKPWIDEGLSWITKYYQHLDLSDAYVVAMCKFCYTHGILSLKYLLISYKSSTLHCALVSQTMF